MSNNISNAINSRFRVSGMVSGLDTDSMIKQMMKVEQMKIDRVQQSKQLIEWRRDAYREVTGRLKSFASKYMDVINPSTNMTSKGNYKAFNVTSNSSSVAVKVSANAMEGTHTITVTNLAKAAYTTSTSSVSNELEGGSVPNLNYAAANKDFNMTLNGTTKNIKLNQDYTDLGSLLADIQSKLDLAFGQNNIIASANSGGDGLKFSASNSKITVSAGSSNALSSDQLNIVNITSNRLNSTTYLDKLAIQNTVSGVVSFKINGVEFKDIDTSTTTMQDLMNKINSSSANVMLSYSEVTDKFTLTAKSKGSGAIAIEDSSGEIFGINSLTGINTGNVTNGEDAVFRLNGGITDIVRNDNSFTIDGISYNLLEEGVSATITVSKDTDAVYSKIKVFVDAYNEELTYINSKLAEKYERAYAPLTDEQRDAMSDEEIKKWEEKAKNGLLQNDTLLSGLVSKLRNSFTDSIAGMTDTLASIGITTGSYTEKGKLIINETKLKDAISKDPDKVTDLFAKESSISFSRALNSTERATRYSQNGFVNKLYDVIQENISAIRDVDGRKGHLLEKAGYIGDASEYSNLIYSSINEKASIIDELYSKMYKKEEGLYTKFAALERALAQMQSQSSWLAQQTGGGN